MRNAIEKGKKIIAVDFTGKYIQKFSDLKPYLFFEDDEEKEKLENNIDIYVSEMVKWANQRDKKIYGPPLEKIKKAITGEVEKYLEESDSNIAILEYPEMLILLSQLI